MYHPLFFFEAQSGCCSRPDFVPAMPRLQRGITSELKGLVPLLKRRFPKSQISYRADAGSAAPEIYATLESLQVLYAIGIGTNAVFQRKTDRWLKRAKRKYARRGKTVRIFCSFRHRARSWPKHRKIVVKIEVGPLGTNLRFVVTHRAGRAEQIFNHYDDRGQCENRIKEFKRDLHSDRLSCYRYAPMLFGFNSTHSLTSCWCSFVGMHLPKLTLFMFGWKPYELSCSKSAPALSKALAAYGSISLRAGQDAICSWRSGKD